MKRLKKYINIFILLIFIITIGCTKRDTEIIKVGYLPIVPDLSFFVAWENDYFKDFGVNVEPIQFAKSVQAIEALTAKRIDITSIVGLSNLLAIEQTEPGTYKIFEMSYADSSTEIHKIIAKEGSDIQSLSDLKGKMIGTFPGSQMKVFTSLVLDDYLDPETDITIIPLSPPNQKDALASGRVDALFTIEPQGTIVTELNIGKLIYMNPLYDLVLKPFPTAASVISSEYLKKYPQKSSNYIKAIYKAIDFINKNPSEAKKYMVKYLNLDEAIAQKVGIYKYWKSKDIDKDAVNHLCKLYDEYQVLDKFVDTSNIYYKE